jgi:hypothetical protein
MAKNIFTNELNNRELMDAFGINQENAPLTPEELADLPQQASEFQTPVQPVIKQNAPKRQDISKKEDTNSDKNEPSSEPTMSKSEALIAEYNKLLGKGEADLAEARKRDRMLKIGGSIGDALATYLNAQSQMNVKAPGVQVQQGAGLGKVADMFATAPEIASDLKDRREALLAQYKAMATDKDLSKSPNAWQIVPVVKDGVQQYISVNKVTNEIRPIGEKATYQQFRVDPGSGNIVAYNPISGGKSSSSSLISEKSTQDNQTQGKEFSNKEKNINELVKETKLKFNPKQKEAVESTIKDFNKDTKEERNTLGSISNLRKTLEMSSDNRAAARAFGTQLAKVFQDGRLSDKDVDLYVKDTDLIQKIRTGYFDMVKGTIDPAKIPEYRQLINSMEQGLSENIITKADFFATQRLGSIVENPEIRREIIYPKQIMQYQKPNQTQTVKDKSIQEYANTYFNGDYEAASKFIEKRKSKK